MPRDLAVFERPLIVKNRSQSVLADLQPETAQGLWELGEGARCENTRRAFDTSIRYWRRWHELRFGVEMTLPLHESTVVQFILDHAFRLRGRIPVYDLPVDVDETLRDEGLKRKPGPVSLNTLSTRLSMLSSLHQRAGVTPNPLESGLVRTAMHDVRATMSAHADLPKPRQAPAITADLLMRIVETCDDSLIGIRDRALLLFGWSSGGRRRSEIASARVEQLTPIDNGFLFSMGHTKTRTEGVERPGAPRQKPVTGIAADALRVWLARSGIQQGPLFQRLCGERASGHGLSGESINRMVKMRARQAGIEAPVTAHSLRSGFVTEAGRCQMDPAAGMAMTDHTSVAAYQRYARAGALQVSPIANLLDIASRGVSAAPFAPSTAERGG